MLKRMSSFFSFFACLLLLSCLVKGDSPAYRKPVYPDKNLKEIVIYGFYVPESKKELEELKEKLRTNERCDINETRTNPRCTRHRLKMGETLEEALKNRFSGVGEEGFGYSRNNREYCYNETDEKDKKPILDKNLRSRLYDKGGNLLSEDFLRQYGSPSPMPNTIHTIHQGVISYLPYHDKGYKIHIVRLKEGKEVILYDKNFLNQSMLRELSETQNYDYIDARGWFYDEKRECHSSDML